MLINSKFNLILESKDIRERNERAGIIIYTIKNGEIFFLLGIDRRTRELTDFGGGCKNKQNKESLIDAGWREFKEESCGIFEDVISKENLYSSIVVTNNNYDTAIFFVKVDNSWLETAEESFKNAQRILKSLDINTESEEENIAIKWIHEKHFKEIAFNRKKQCMWSRIQSFLIKNIESYNELHNKLIEN